MSRPVVSRPVVSRPVVSRPVLGLLGVSLLALAAPGALAAPARKARAPRKAAAAPGAPALVRLSIAPAKVRLSGRGMSQRFLVFGHTADGGTRDVTALARVARSGTGGVALAPGRVTATLDGDVRVTASLGAMKAAMQVTVQDVAQPVDWSFANEIVPIFTKSGCNTGGCHGSPSGRGTFKLSIWGFEPDYDYDMVTKDRNGRRINLAQPDQSLVLLKSSGQVPHGGGPRFRKDSEFYHRLLEWLKDGARKQPEFDPRLNEIQIYPGEWTFDRPQQQQQVLVMAVRDDGTTQDVTHYARYTTNDDRVADVDDDGVLTSTGAGETAIMVRYLGAVGVVRVKTPRPPVPARAYANFRPANYIDQAVLARLKEVRIPPSDLASDAEFLRRACVDTCGMTPTIEEARAFLDDRDPNKRVRLIDSLLNRPEFVDYWTLRWSDLLRNNAQVKQGKGLQAFYRFIREGVRTNKPYDQFARELILASGSSFRNGPVNWYNLPNDVPAAEYPLFMASATSQVFLGVRIDCARCHNHPFESWSQVDYYGLAAFFARTRSKGGVDEDEEVFFAASEGEVRHPRTNVVIQPKLLGGDVVTFATEEDRREKLAEWITSPARNRWFARSIANRLWNAFMGRGLVHPVDDYRLTNPASNERLLDALAEKVVAYRFDLKSVMRDILLSRTYQTSSVPNKLNVDDRLYNSHALPRRLYAEVLLDAVVYATDVPEKFGPYEYGRRAISIPDNTVPSGFLDLFGRARRQYACECERPEETNVSMVLNLINGDAVNGRIRHPNGRAARAASSGRPPKEIFEEFYLATLARRPTAREEAAAAKLLAAAPNLREGAEDVLWCLLNMKEFLFNH